MKVEKVFIVVRYGNALLDYPQNMPLPRIGESVLLYKHGESRRVIDIRHNITESVGEVTIICE